MVVVSQHVEYFSTMYWVLQSDPTNVQGISLLLCTATGLMVAVCTCFLLPKTAKDETVIQKKLVRVEVRDFYMQDRSVNNHKQGLS